MDNDNKRTLYLPLNLAYHRRLNKYLLVKSEIWGWIVKVRLGHSSLVKKPSGLESPPVTNQNKKVTEFQEQNKNMLRMWHCSYKKLST